MKTYEELVEVLGENGKVFVEEGASFIYKQSPDGESGVLDLREALVANITKEDLKKNPQAYPQNIVDNYSNLFPEITEDDPYVYEGIPVGIMRKSMGWNNIDLTTSILTEEKTIQSNNLIPIKIYRPDTEKTNRPCLIYFHGGGFIAGSTQVVENPCKDIAQKADAVVISVDYRLAPEHPFPKGLDDCYETVLWACEEADQLGIDRMKIGVAGDSAGGNLAAACALRDRDEECGRIHYQALLYAALKQGDEEEYQDYHWSMSRYDDREKNPHIEGACTWIRDSAKMLRSAYVQKSNPRHPYISPLDTKRFDGLPRTLIATAEYDYLRIECDLYGKRLAAAGVDVRNIRYGGMRHAYLDKYGFFPQAEDCVNEIVHDLKIL